MGFFKNIFKENADESIMRFNFFLISVGCVLVILSVALYIVIAALKCTLAMDWNSMGIFLGGVATIVTGAGYNKWKQKQIENNINNNEEEKNEK